MSTADVSQTTGCAAHVDHDRSLPDVDLLSPLTLRGVTLRNRIGVSPMCQYVAKDGFADDWHLVHLGSRAAGGAGLVVVEATAVTRDGRITPGDVGIWDDQHAEPLARIAKFIHSQGAVAGIQLAHAGRKASCDLPWKGGAGLSPERGGWPVVAPSALRFAEGSPHPHPLSEDGIRDVLAAFAAAADRAVRAGFRVIELHAAHGYLLHEFLSPLTNHRLDDYGGSLENRMRLPLRVAEALRKRIPEELPLFVRISATDWVDEGGWDLEQSVAFAAALRDRCIDLIDCSSGGAVPKASIPVGRNYQVPLAEAIRHRAGVRTAAVGLITETQQANDIIQSGAADLVMIAREMLREPYWALRAQQELGQEPSWPISYGYAVKRRR